MHLRAETELNAVGLYELQRLQRQHIGLICLNNYLIHMIIV